jgi:hypothetical protein
MYGSADAIRTKPLTIKNIRMAQQMQSKLNCSYITGMYGSADAIKTKL